MGFEFTVVVISWESIEWEGSFWSFLGWWAYSLSQPWQFYTVYRCVKFHPAIHIIFMHFTCLTICIFHLRYKNLWFPGAGEGGMGRNSSKGTNFSDRLKWVSPGDQLYVPVPVANNTVLYMYKYPEWLCFSAYFSFFISERDLRMV